MRTVETRVFRLGCLPLLALCGISACDAGNGSTSGGQPTLKGSVSGSVPAGDKRPLAALVWSKSGGQVLSTTSDPIEISSDLRFNLVLRQPPPPSVTFEIEPGKKWAMAWIGVLRSGSPTGDLGSPAAVIETIIGGSPSSMVLYVDGPHGASSLLGRLVGAGLTAGYHLLAVRLHTAAETAALGECRAAATAMAKDPKLECPAFKMHVSPAKRGFDEDIVLQIAPSFEFPDLS